MKKKFLRESKGSIPMILGGLEDLKEKNYLIIVEGEKDKAALEKLGLSNIFTIHKTGISLYNRIEEIKNLLGKREKCVILTDVDKKGKELYHLIKNKLLEEGVKMDNSFRNLLLAKKISHIEGLATFVKRTP